MRESTSKLQTIIFGSAIITTPEVPRYQIGGADQTAPLQTPRAGMQSPDANGAGLGQGLQNVGKTLFALAEDEKKKADTAATIGAVGDLYEWKRTNLYDPEKGALFRRGADAFNVDRKVDDDFKKFVAEKEFSLANDEQKATFRRFAISQGESIAHETASHVHRELTTYAKQRTEGAIKNAFDLISANPTDENLQQILPTIKGFIVADAAANKEPAELTDFRIKSAESEAHFLIISRMAMANLIAAKEYFDANRNRMLGADAIKMEHLLKPLVEDQAALNSANEIYCSAGEKDTRAMMLKTANEKHKSEPGVLKKVESQILTLYQAREDAHKKEITDAEDSVYSYLAKVKLAGGVPKRSDVPNEAWMQLSALDPEKASKIADEIRQGQEHAIDRARAQQDRLEAKATIANLTTWGLLKTNPKDLAGVNLDRLLGSNQITKMQYQDLVTDQLAIKQGKGEHEMRLLSDKAAVDSVLHAVKITEKKNPEQYMKFYDAMNTRIKLYEAENGKRPQQAEVVTIARGLLSEVAQDVNYWPVDKTVKAYEADVTKVRVPDVDRVEITRALKKNGRPVTEDLIKEYYLERKRRSGGVK